MPISPPVDHAAELARIDRIARLMDARFGVLGFRFGLDSIIGLVPGIGDVAVAAPSVWMIWKARQMGMPQATIAKMAVNTGIDFALGSVPLIGDLFDVVFKANLRNAALLRAGIEAAAAQTETPDAGHRGSSVRGSAPRLRD